MPTNCGSPVLSPAELQVLRHVARGLSYAQAARETGRSVSTVRSLIHTSCGRLGVATIVQAVARCTELGWLDPVTHDGASVEAADPRVTWAQRLYLEAFDQSLRALDDPEELERTQLLRDAALAGVLRESGKSQPWRRAPRDPITRISRRLVPVDLGPTGRRRIPAPRRRPRIVQLQYGTFFRRSPSRPDSTTA